jgi:cytochrome P450
MGVIRDLLKWYAGLGLAHVVVKFIASLLKVRRNMKMIAGAIPRANYKDDPIMGNLSEFLQQLPRRHDYTSEMTKGLPISYCISGPKFDDEALEVMCRDPKVIKHFLKDNYDNYTKAEGDMFWETLRLWLGNGIFASAHGAGASDGGQNWHRQRKIASAIFSRGNFNDNMAEVFASKGRRMCEVLKASAAKGQAVDMQAKFFQYTMDSIMQIFYGEPVDTMGGQENSYATAYDQAHRCIVEYFLTSIAGLSLLKMLPWPFGGVNGVAHFLHRSTHPLYKEFKVAWDTVDRESRRMVAATRKDPNLSARKDLLALFVQQAAQDFQAGKSTPKNGTCKNGAPKSCATETMTTEWLRDVVMNFVIAGRDTTACTLSWMFYILATHPEIQRKLQAELDEKFKPGETPTIQSVSHSSLPYLNGLLYETLRLYPPVPIDGKAAKTDDVLPGGIKIPAGTRMSFLIYAMGRDAQVYPEPEMVRPERWIPFKEPSPFEFPVFQAGPRICLGQNMAIFEAKIIAAMLLREFSFEMKDAEAHKITYHPVALTLSIVNTKGTDQNDLFDSHNLWLTPKVRKA